MTKANDEESINIAKWEHDAFDTKAEENRLLVVGSLISDLLVDIRGLCSSYCYKRNLPSALTDPSVCADKNALENYIHRMSEVNRATIDRIRVVRKLISAMIIRIEGNQAERLKRVLTSTILEVNEISNIEGVCSTFDKQYAVNQLREQVDVVSDQVRFCPAIRAELKGFLKSISTSLEQSIFSPSKNTPALNDSSFRRALRYFRGINTGVRLLNSELEVYKSNTHFFYLADMLHNFDHFIESCINKDIAGMHAYQLDLSSEVRIAGFKSIFGNDLIALIPSLSVAANHIDQMVCEYDLEYCA